MERARLETKVGWFVLFTLGLMAALMVFFSKGVTRFARTYELHLLTENIGGLKQGAGVLMAGYTVGNVAAIDLNKNGDAVELTLQIKQQYRIRTNAMFVIEQSGFLGDQYVAIYASTNREAPFFKDGETAVCPPPFNLQQVARNAAGFVQRIDETARRLNAAIDDVRRLVLNEQTLTNIAATVDNMRSASERAQSTVEEIHKLVETNRAPLAVTLSNLVVFSSQIERASAGVNTLVETNSPALASAVKNIETSTVILESLLADVKAGKGLAGVVFQNDEVATNVAAIAENLSITTSNLNRRGLWGILWKQKDARTNAPVGERLSAPHDPFR